MTAYVRVGNRLAVYAQRATSGFWEQSWGRLSESRLEHALRATGRLGVDGLFFRRHLPRDGVVLEAGCGVGVVARRLSYRGYRVVGVDFAVPSLVRSKRVCDDLRLVGGDVLNLPFRPAS